MLVTVYTKEGCMQCRTTAKMLAQMGVAYELVDVERDDGAAAKVSELGYRQLPVVTAGENHWSGFQPDKIKSLSNGETA